jgi:hypothetical protein
MSRITTNLLVRQEDGKREGTTDVFSHHSLLEIEEKTRQDRNDPFLQINQQKFANGLSRQESQQHHPKPQSEYDG